MLLKKAISNFKFHCEYEKNLSQKTFTQQVCFIAIWLLLFNLLNYTQMVYDVYVAYLEKNYSEFDRSMKIYV